MTKYRIVARPRGENKDGKNLGGIVVLLLKDGEDPSDNGQELGRVAFDRSQSKNPNVDFEAQLKIEVDKAKAAITQINALFQEAGQLV